MKKVAKFIWGKLVYLAKLLFKGAKKTTDMTIYYLTLFFNKLSIVLKYAFEKISKAA